jgi:hypothetical protein
VEFEASYIRMASDSEQDFVAVGSMELVPITMALCYRVETPGAELYAGGGFALAVFTERTVVGTVTGAKPGADMRVGTRIHTDLVQTSIRPMARSNISGMDVELFLARRQHHAFGIGSGFDYSAWRVGVGVVGRL